MHISHRHKVYTLLLIQRHVTFNLPKMESPKSEGHVTPNEDKYQKSVQLKFR